MPRRNPSPAAALPAVDRVLRAERVRDLPRPLALQAVRTLLAELRVQVLAGGTVPSFDELTQQVEAQVAAARLPALRRVLNASGVVLHTNMGRAPLAAEARSAVAAAIQGYASVEIDLDSGGRGERLAGVARRLRACTGAEDAIAVNNNAAAVLLALTALARDRAVVVSRGELVEIGGSFRIPEVAAAGGAQLVEVGCTNRTRVADYAAAMDADQDRRPVGLLRVHRSNFRIIGFTEEPERGALAALARERGVWLYEDLGSGNLVPGIPGEPTVQEVIAAGVDLVSFSGDKLLGGPQAGIIAGRRALVRCLRRHPLYRALRLDKMSLAALDATLRMHVEGRAEQVPTVAMLRARPSVLRQRCQILVQAVGRPDLDLACVETEGRAGAGALPERPLPSVAVAVACASAEVLARLLREGDPPVIGRQHQDRLLLDPRTLMLGEEAAVGQALRRALHELCPPAQAL